MRRLHHQHTALLLRYKARSSLQLAEFRLCRRTSQTQARGTDASIWLGLGGDMHLAAATFLSSGKNGLS